MTQSNVISINQFVDQLPTLLKKTPRMIRGLMLTRQSSTKTNTGLGWAVEKAARHNSYGAAVLYKDTQINYRDFNQWANQIAHYFKQTGLQKGDVVAVLLENRPELLAVVTGLAKIGVVSALVNTSQTGSVLEHSINLVKPKAMIVGEEMFEVFQAVLPNLELKQNPVYWLADANTLLTNGTAPAIAFNLATEIKTQPNKNPKSTQSICGQDGLFYIYTSGTTGLPKAAIFNHGRFMKAYGGFGYTLQLDKDDIIYVTLPLYHATGMVVCWGSALAGYSGIALRRKFSASEFWKDVSYFNASTFGYVGELCRYLLDRPAHPDDKNHRLTKMIGNGLRPTIWTEFKTRFGIQQVMEFYASSEGNIGFSNVFNFDHTMGFSPMPYAIVKYDEECAQPVRNDQGFMVKVKQNESGLLIGKITSKTPFDGYTDASKSKSSILENVFETGDRYFNTGDLVKSIGFRHTQFVDRTGDTFRWKGENVSTTEVENKLSPLTSIQDAVVYGVEIPNTNGRAGMAAITPAEGVSISAKETKVIYQHLKNNLPAYAIPVFLRIQQTTTTTATFKYQKHTLKKEAFDPQAVADDKLWVLLPKADHYVPLDLELFQQVCDGKFRF